MSSSTLRFTLAIVLCILMFTGCCDAKRKKGKKTMATMVQAKQQTSGMSEAKQAELRETNPPNFVRLLIMRLVYGVATQMGLEERISGVFNGAFAPPNADYDDFGVGDFGIDEGIGDLGDDLF